MKRRKIPLVTFIILGLNVLGFILEYARGEDFVIYSYGMFEHALRLGPDGWVRLAVSAFLHFGIYHLASNMICLVIYGFALENRIGSLRYLLVYTAAILGSGLFVNFAGGNGIHAGASGAVWGLMTATLIYNLKNGLSPYYALRGIVVNLVYSFSSNVSWQGHIGGGLAGLAAAFLMFRKPREKLYGKVE